jgi:hypothetical protein
MAKRKKGGIFIERELYQSPAWMSLKRTFSPKLLLLFLDKRIREPQPKGRRGPAKFINLNCIEMTYSELETKYGVSRQTITRALDELLEKGFIEIRHHGGTFRHEKTIYAIVDNWLFWKPGDPPCSTRKPESKRGYQGREIGASRKTSAQSVTPTHAQSVPPNAVA